MMDAVSLAVSLSFGAVVGIALGLTGGGGGVFAVPMLVYGLSMAPREAVGISLAAVGGTALVGVLPRLRSRQIELGTGLWFALAGMLGAPFGSWAAGQIPEWLLLLAFAVLMLLVAVRMWRRSSAAPASGCGSPQRSRTLSCNRGEDGRLRLTSQCAVILATLGLITGFLSGLFGVGGGFVIVPALVLFSGMPMHRAVGTSLLVIVMVSITGVAAHFAAGRSISWPVAVLFLLGGIAGMAVGTRLGQRMSGPWLQKVFAIGVLSVAVFVLGHTVV